MTITLTQETETRLRRKAERAGQNIKRLQSPIGRRGNLMDRSQMTSDEVGRLGEAIYAQSIRAKVEIEENIGKMVIIDVETGEYEIDELGLEASRHLHAKHPDAALYGIRIGYNVAATLGGVMERVTR